MFNKLYINLVQTQFGMLGVHTRCTFFLHTTKDFYNIVSKAQPFSPDIGSANLNKDFREFLQQVSQLKKLPNTDLIHIVSSTIAHGRVKPHSYSILISLTLCLSTIK